MAVEPEPVYVVSFQLSLGIVISVRVGSREKKICSSKRGNEINSRVPVCRTGVVVDRRSELRFRYILHRDGLFLGWYIAPNTPVHYGRIPILNPQTELPSRAPPGIMHRDTERQRESCSPNRAWQNWALCTRRR